MKQQSVIRPYYKFKLLTSTVKTHITVCLVVKMLMMYFQNENWLCFAEILRPTHHNQWTKTWCVCVSVRMGVCHSAAVSFSSNLYSNHLDCHRTHWSKVNTHPVTQIWHPYICMHTSLHPSVDTHTCTHTHATHFTVWATAHRDHRADGLIPVPPVHMLKSCWSLHVNGWMRAKF